MRWVQRGAYGVGESALTWCAIEGGNWISGRLDSAGSSVGEEFRTTEKRAWIALRSADSPVRKWEHESLGTTDGREQAPCASSSFPSLNRTLSTDRCRLVRAVQPPVASVRRQQFSAASAARHRGSVRTLGSGRWLGSSSRFRCARGRSNPLCDDRGLDAPPITLAITNSSAPGIAHERNNLIQSPSASATAGSLAWCFRHSHPTGCGTGHRCTDRTVRWIRRSSCRRFSGSNRSGILGVRMDGLECTDGGVPSAPTLATWLAYSSLRQS